MNIGKSTLINALIGHKLLETGSIPTTDTITVLTSSNKSSISSENNIRTTTIHSKNAITLHRVPNIPLLKDLTFIDTPGTNAIIANHTTRTLKLLPSADLILFVTSADRPFPESERKLLQSIQSYRKNIVIIINKMDILEDSGGNYGDLEKKKVIDFVAENAADLLGARAIILPVSAKDALAAKLIHGNRNRNINFDSGEEGRIDSSKIWKRSGFDTLETFLKDSLTEQAKVQAKLLNPLGVTDGLITECLTVLEERKKELEADVMTLNLLNSQMSAWRRDMDSDIELFQIEVKDHMKKEMDRCRAFIDSIGFFERYSLLSSDNAMLQTKWENTKSIIVSDDVQKEIFESVRESTDAIATSARAQGQAVIEYLGKRPTVVGQNLIGNVTAASRFEDTRKELHDKTINAVEAILSSYNSEEEKMSVFKSVKTTTYISTILNSFSAVSGIVTAMNMCDILLGGCATAGFAILGLGIVPQRNQSIIHDFETRWEKRNEKLSTALDTLCKKEITRIHKRILDGVAPYSRYVTTEQENVNDYSQECQKIAAISHSLRNKIIKL